MKEKQKHAPPPSGADRPDEAGVEGRARRSRVVGWAAATAVLGLAALYGVLYVGSRLAQPETARLAALDADEMDVEGYSLQSAGSRAAGGGASPDALYLRALGHLREAPVSTLGLFPRYDEGELERAATLLARVGREAEPGSFLQLEAAYYLGKARLAQGDRAGATQALKRVIAGEGRQASEAAHLLQELHAEAAYDGP